MRMKARKKHDKLSRYRNMFQSIFKKKNKTFNCFIWLELYLQLTQMMMPQVSPGDVCAGKYQYFQFLRFYVCVCTYISLYTSHTHIIFYISPLSFCTWRKQEVCSLFWVISLFSMSSELSDTRSAGYTELQIDSASSLQRPPPAENLFRHS